MVILSLQLQLVYQHSPSSAYLSFWPQPCSVAGEMSTRFAASSLALALSCLQWFCYMVFCWWLLHRSLSSVCSRFLWTSAKHLILYLCLSIVFGTSISLNLVAKCFDDWRKPIVSGLLSLPIKYVVHLSLAGRCFYCPLGSTTKSLLPCFSAGDFSSIVLNTHFGFSFALHNTALYCWKHSLSSTVWGATLLRSVVLPCPKDLGWSLPGEPISSTKSIVFSFFSLGNAKLIEHSLRFNSYLSAGWFYVRHPHLLVWRTIFVSDRSPVSGLDDWITFAISGLLGLLLGLQNGENYFQPWFPTGICTVSCI